MPHFAVKCPSWWNSNDHLKNAQLKVGSPPRHCHDVKHLVLQPPDQKSTTVQMTGASYHKVGAVGRTNSQDQCISSESDQDEGGAKAVEGQMKPIFLLNNPNVMFNTSQVAHSHSMAQVPYPYAEPCFSGLLTAYGPHAIIQPQMVGVAPARVPLPLDLTDDGPIYVNPKQYHGILRRRQSRAKLEAQNKVVKARKPYLHESRHRHALNRIRGSGGRFVSTRKLQNPNLTRKHQNPDSAASSSGHCVTDFVDFHPSENRSEFDRDKFGTDHHVASLRTCSDISSVSNSSDSKTFQQPNRRFSVISPHLSGAMQCNGGLVSGGTQHCASVVR